MSKVIGWATDCGDQAGPPMDRSVAMWSSTKKLRIDRSLYRRLAAVAEAAGYASTQELITHVLERAADHSDTSADDNADSNSHPGDGVISNAAADAEVEKQLRGLGYLE